MLKEPSPRAGWWLLCEWMMVEMSHSTNCHFVTCIYCRQYSLSGSGLDSGEGVRSVGCSMPVEWSASDMVFIRRKKLFCGEWIAWMEECEVRVRKER